MVPPITLITAYQPAGDTSLLPQSLAATVAEIRRWGNGRIVLVANGVLEDGARPPEEFIAPLGKDGAELIIPYRVARNNGGGCGLNAGIAFTLLRQEDHEDGWIGQVQPSVLLASGWLNRLVPAGEASAESDGLLGRLMIWPSNGDPATVVFNRATHLRQDS